MKAGIPVGIEVGDVYGLEECWELVRTYEETETPFMFMENCCYGRRKLMALNMIKEKQPGASHSMRCIPSCFSYTLFFAELICLTLRV